MTRYSPLQCDRLPFGDRLLAGLVTQYSPLQCDRLSFGDRLLAGFGDGGGESTGDVTCRLAQVPLRAGAAASGTAQPTVRGGGGGVSLLPRTGGEGSAGPGADIFSTLLISVRVMLI